MSLETKAETLALRSTAATRSMQVDGSIAALWGAPMRMNTVEIAEHLGLRESFVANRLAAIRDSGRP